MAKSHGESFAVNVGAGFALMLLGQLMKFVIKTVFIYTLGMQYTGVSTLFTDILSMLALAELGIGHAITFALYKPIRDKDYRRIAALMAFYKKAYQLIAITILVLGAACIPLLPFMVKDVPDIKENISIIFMLYVINNSASYLLIYKSTLLTASEMRWVISRTSMVFVLIRTAVEIVVLLVFKNFIIYLIVGIVEQFARNYAISRRASKLYPQLDSYKNERLDKGETRKLLADVGALSLYKISHVILSSTDSIVISLAPALGVVSVGYLGNYRLIFTMINTTVTQFYQSFVPTLGTIATTADSDRQYKLFNSVYFVSFWIVLFCSTSLFCLAEPFVQDIWLTKKHVLDRSVLFALTFNFYITITLRPLNAFRNGNGLFIQGKYRPLATAVLNLVLDFALVGSLGVFGVLFATSLSIICTQLWYDSRLVYKKVFNRPPMEYAKKFITHFLMTVLCTGFTYLLCEYTSGVIHNVHLAFLVRMIWCAVIPNALVILIYRKSDEFKDVKKRLDAMTKRLRRKLHKGGGSGKKRKADGAIPIETQPTNTESDESIDTRFTDSDDINDI